LSDFHSALREPELETFFRESRATWFFQHMEKLTTWSFVEENIEQYASEKQQIIFRIAGI
jgi:hypothetical protein